MTQSQIMRAERQERAARESGPLGYDVICRIWSKPGVTAAELPQNRRCYLKKLETAGAIEYRDGGWYAR